jgi:aryl-alcohol dehydrogenase-like predicted oxidoreductase
MNDRGLSRKHIIESCDASLERLQTDYIDLYQAHRFDYETPLEETLRAFDDLVRAGKVHYIGVSSGRPRDRGALRSPGEMGSDRIVSSQPQYSMLWRIIEAEVVPLCEREGIGQVCLVADRAGRAHRQVPAGPAAAGGAPAPPTSTAATR